MERYGPITNVTFGQSTLPLPMSVRLLRQAGPLPARSDCDAFCTSIQIDQPVLAVELRMRDTAVAEDLSLGQSGLLTVQLAPTRSGQEGRTISINHAVLTAIELQYDQTVPAVAKLNFVAEAGDGDTDPFFAQDLEQ